jgi:hypothetical protein
MNQVFLKISFNGSTGRPGQKTDQGLRSGET